MSVARLQLAAVAGITVLVVVAFALRDPGGDDDPATTTATSAAAPADPAASSPTAPPTTTATTAAPDPTTPTTAGALPAVGDGGGLTPTGAFAAAPGASGVAGAGPLVTYIVEVETAIPIVPADWAAAVDAILAAPAGWTAGGARSFQRVEDPAAAAFRLVLATPATTDELCAPLRTNRIFSCFNHGAVVINLDRWNLGAEAQSGLPLDLYRIYLISHEVGHALGFGHVGCPAPGAPAPVMMQQTKSIEGCAPNPWPNP